ncbi:MAG: CehA/McbA family metallohydrolase, partial [Planctomycetes bacterium]|nr:CehA/McbA family metallohydrolase [Planctomycetota bacterium]
GELSQTRPFVAAAYLPVGVAAERVKRSATLGDQKRAIESLREAAARLDILKTGRMAWTDPGLLALLPLAADPDAQVSIQFASGSRCGLVFYCGAVPFITAEVARMASDAKARESLDPKPDEPFAMPREKIKIDGMEARRGRLPYDTEIMDRLNIDVQRQVLLVQPAKKRVLVLDLGQISCVQAQAYTYMPGCPDGIRTTVKQWASTTHLSESTLEEALKKDRVLMAGDVNVAGIAEWFKGMKFYKVKPVDQAEELIVAWGDRVIHLWCPSRKAAEDVVRLIVARAPVTPAKADALREQLVRDTMPATIVKADMPQGTHLYAGDFHMHTYYSDGQPSPAALALQAIGGAYMDFAALSDHNTLSGAKEAKRLLTAGGLAFPLMTGLEITTKWAHFNAYPVKELIPWDAKAGDVDGLIAAAHAQGAVIQWNHPGFPGSPWEIEQIPTALDRVGADAWEHVPTEYDRWKQLKACPLLVGTTDTHNGTFTPAECTIILAASPQGPAVVEAIQNRLAVAVLPFYAKIFYGPDPVVALAWSALADGKGLRAAKAGELKKVLKKADLPVILRDAPSKPVAKMGTW